MTPAQQTHRLQNALLIGLILGLIGGGGWLLYDDLQQRDRVAALDAANQDLSDDLAARDRELSQIETTLQQVSEQLEETQDELDETEEDLRDEENRNEAFAERLEDLGQTVGNLNRLAELDEELLMKYSRVSFLNENYNPRTLDQIEQDWVLEGRGDQYILPQVLPFLEELLADAAEDDMDLRIVSAFRSFDEQREVKNGHEVVYGEGSNQFSADQGYSEHQLGSTVDFTTPDIPGAREEFASTKEYEWLLDNAHKYGFVLSYPEGNQFYVFEPWHWRFVGVDLAEDLEDANANFYDWEQRRIDEYLIDIFAD